MRGFMLLAAIAISGCSAAAAEFEMYGVKQGMTKSQVEEFVKGRGWTITINDKFWDIRGMGALGTDSLWVAFCNDEQVNWTSYMVRGGFINFLRVVEEYKGAGWVVYETNSDLFVAANGKQLGGLTLKMSRVPEPYTVELIANLQNDADVWTQISRRSLTCP